MAMGLSDNRNKIVKPNVEYVQTSPVWLALILKEPKPRTIKLMQTK
jgi:hypothetical protein